MFDSVSVANFMRIRDQVLIPLGPVTVLVGENGSGKSSVLKAIHWAIRCAILRDNAGRVTLERMDYVPSRDILNVGHKSRLNSERVSPRVVVELSIASDKLTISMQSSRNDAGIKTIVSGALAHTINGSPQITAYIPGLAGLAETETLLANPVLNRRAASGEGGSVLRHILFLLATARTGMDSLESFHELTDLSFWVERIFPGVRFWVKFDRVRDVHIDARFLTKDMADPGKKLETTWRPLEMAGTGFLQVVQIFAYLLHFKPKVLLIDEPDSHLHPGTQERLIRAIEDAAVAFPETQFLITTHSSNFVKTAGPVSRVLWMSDGSLRPEKEDLIKRRMGWGALDKDLMLITEDGNLSYMRAILRQWPELERRIMLWPTFGSGSLPSGSALKRIKGEFGIPIIVHRDRDFMSDTDKAAFEKKREYDTCSIPLWMPVGSDIEAGFCTPENLEAAFELVTGDGTALLNEALDTLDKNEIETEFNTAYQAAIAGLPFAVGSAPSIRWKVLGEFGTRTTKGKTLLAAVRKALAARYAGSPNPEKLKGLSNLCTPLVPLHLDLKAMIEATLGQTADRTKVAQHAP